MRTTGAPSSGRYPSEAVDLCLGELLRQLRVSRKLTLSDAVARGGGRFGRSALGSWERGERPLTVERLDALAAMYDVDTAWLLDEAVARAGADTANTCKTATWAPVAR